MPLSDTDPAETGPAGVEPDAPRVVGRPRSTRAHEAIIEATLDLLSCGTTIDELTIEQVAAKAGVGKATIYRRWSGKDELLFEAMMRLKGVPQSPTGTSVRDDLVFLLNWTGRAVDKRAVQVMPCLVPEVVRSPEYYRLWQEYLVQPRREMIREVLRRGMRSGELRADFDLEVAMLVLTGPLLVQRMLHWSPELDEAGLTERVVDQVLAGLRAA